MVSLDVVPPTPSAIILAAVGDLEAALRAQKMARSLIEQHRPAAG